MKTGEKEKFIWWCILGAIGGSRSSYCLSAGYAHRNSPDVHSDGIGYRDSFCVAACRQNPLSEMDARVSSGHMERSARRNCGYRTGYAGTRRNVDVRYEPEQHEQLHRNLVHSGSDLSEEAYTEKLSIPHHMKPVGNSRLTDFHS